MSRHGGVCELPLADRSPSEQLPGALATLLAREHLALSDVDVFGVAAGPGSLTGLRVGIATIQGLAFAADRRVVAVSALEALAVRACVQHGPLAARTLVAGWTEAHRGEVFTAVYEVQSGAPAGDRQPSVRTAGTVKLVEREPPAVGAPDEVLARWRAMERDAAMLITGNAVAAHADALRAALRHVEVDPGGPLAGIVATLAGERHARGESAAPHAVQPLYVRRPDAVLARERRQAT